MESDLQRLFDSVETLGRKANVNVAFGRPVATEGRTVIPVAEVSYGFGLGFGSAGEEETAEAAGGVGGGGGGGVRTRPIAMVEVAPEGIRVEPLVDEGKITLAGILLVGWSVFWIARALMRIFGKR
ncbi:MAG TPA: hypothetical protein G4O00_03510 [Thermoflexia bacterium]|jgi:uncharacterized spore protein YtfJ|nr:hypothetical protein [Thermoflexia bacterium]